MADYNNLNYALTRELIKMLKEGNKSCNDVLHFKVENRGRQLLRLNNGSLNG